MPARALGLAAPARELGEVVGARGRLDLAHHPRQAREHAPRVADDRDLHGHVLADLGGIDVDVDDPRVRRVGADVAGDPVVEPHADGEQQVRGLDRPVDVLPAVHPHVAVASGCVLVQGADAQQRPGHGDLRPLGKCPQLVPRLGDEDAVTGQDHRPARLLDLLRRQLELPGVALDGGPEAGQTGDDLLGGGVRGGRLLLQGVLGDVDVDGPGPAAARDVERLRDDPRQVVSVADQVVVLGHRQRDAGDVDLLEGILAEEGRRHVAGDRDHRHRVQLGGRRAP